MKIVNRCIFSQIWNWGLFIYLMYRGLVELPQNTATPAWKRGALFLGSVVLYEHGSIRWVYNRRRLDWNIYIIYVRFALELLALGTCMGLYQVDLPVS